MRKEWRVTIAATNGDGDQAKDRGLTDIIECYSITTISFSRCEVLSSVWSDSLVNSVKIDDDGEVTDFENENDFKTLFYFCFQSFRLQAFISELICLPGHTGVMAG